MKLNYLRPVNKGTLYGEGEIVRIGKQVIVGKGEIKDSVGRMVAFGTATFMITKLEDL